MQVYECLMCGHQDGTTEPLLVCPMCGSSKLTLKPEVVTVGDVKPSQTAPKIVTRDRRGPGSSGLWWL